MMSLIRISAVCCLLMFTIHTANSVKCYQCVSNKNIADCQKNQTLIDCKPTSPCLTILVVFAYNGVPTLNTYMKNCFPSSKCSSYFNETGVIKVHSCNLKRCSTDYCNGVPPTTIPVTSGNTHPVSSGKTPGTQTSSEGPASSGSILHSTSAVFLASVLWSTILS